MAKKANQKEQPKMQVIEKYSNMNITITIYPNRVEVVDRRGCYSFLSPKRTLIPFHNISSVEVPNILHGLTTGLIITTNDGEKHKYPCDLIWGKRLRDAINQNI